MAVKESAQEFEMLGPNGKFKKAVIESARKRADGIIKQAHEKRMQALQEAHLTCEATDRDTIVAKAAKETGRKYAAEFQKEREALLQFRDEQVEQVFMAVRQKLQAFAASDAYAGWLTKRIRQASLALPPSDAERTIWLRLEDMPMEQSLLAVLPGCAVRQDDTIKLGGAKLTCGNLLLDETLDEGLRMQSEAFSAQSGLTM